MIFKESELVNRLFNLVINWIDINKNELSLNTDIETFKENFYYFFYKKIKSQDIIFDDNYDYFETKYNSDIIDLLSYMKKICNDYCNNNLKYTNINFLDFIYNNVYFDVDINISDDEDNEDIII